ncbi:MAG: response regulator transcription factor [Thiolinea sp.]
MKNIQIYRVFLVEDDNGTLQRLAKVVSDEPNLELVGTAMNYTDASEWLSTNELDVLLTDLGLPDGNGKQLIEQTVAQHENAEIMVVSRFGDENSVVEAIKAGAGGYLLKDESQEHIADSIRQLLQGGSPISPAIARYILDYFKNDEIAESNPDSSETDHDALLTPKEKMVLQYISRGYSNKEIARSLEISPHTVASHIKRIYRKLAVNSRNEAVFEGWRMGQLTIHKAVPAQSKANRDALQVAQALLSGGKNCQEVMDVLHLAYQLNQEGSMQVMQQAGCAVADIYSGAKYCFGLDDKQVVEALLKIGFSHEEALQAMLG